MQDNIFDTHTVFGGHMDVNSYTYKPVVCFDLKSSTHVTPIFKARLTLSKVFEDLLFLLFNFFTRPPSITQSVIFLPVHHWFYQSK